MEKMSAKKQISAPNPKDYINCPLDLDSLIMAPTITPDVMELNCALADDNILFAAIRLSTCAYWMFKLDVLEQFSSDFRWRLYGCLPGMARTTRMYFNYQIENSNHKVLLEEYRQFLLQTGILGGDPLNNPLSMLGNTIKDVDIKVLQGQMTPRQMLLNQIQEFLTTKNKEKIDFSYSLFLPEFLNPKFFIGLSEAEQIVLLGNLGKYFEFLSKFHRRGMGFRGTIQPRNELFPPQLLVKHVLMDEKNTYTNRVKMMAWNQLCNEIDRLSQDGKQSWNTGKVFSFDKLSENYDWLGKQIEGKGWRWADIENWLSTSEGLFESFELDCTLHSMDASNFVLFLLTRNGSEKMARGLMDFQDMDVRNKLFKLVGDALRPFR